MTALRLGAVSYLNTKPLVYGLDAIPDQFDVRFDVPAKCATLLHEGQVDLGLIPAIEFLRGTEDYWIVPGVAIASEGDVASVAVFSKKPIEQVASIALDLSSRTSVALTRILCARRWGIAPAFTPAEPDLDAMLAIGRRRAGDWRSGARRSMPPPVACSRSIWAASGTRLTGLPFVYAMWTGRAGAASPAQCRALQAAREQGEANLPAHCPRGRRRRRRPREARALALPA